MNLLKDSLPKEIPVFPLSNFIIFPKTTVPLNIFEPRYIEMVDDAMKDNRIIGMIQPKKSDQNIPSLYNVGCVGKITSFNETEDGRYLINLEGINLFLLKKEIDMGFKFRIIEGSSIKHNSNNLSIDSNIKKTLLNKYSKYIKNKKIV